MTAFDKFMRQIREMLCGGHMVRVEALVEQKNFHA